MLTSTHTYSFPLQSHKHSKSKHIIVPHIQSITGDECWVISSVACSFHFPSVFMKPPEPHSVITNGTLRVCIYILRDMHTFVSYFSILLVQTHLSILVLITVLFVDTVHPGKNDDLRSQILTVSKRVARYLFYLRGVSAM